MSDGKTEDVSATTADDTSLANAGGAATDDETTQMQVINRSLTLHDIDDDEDEDDWLMID